MGGYNGPPLARPVVATISTYRGRVRNNSRNNSTRGRGYYQGRSGYRGNYSRLALTMTEPERGTARPAIAFVKEGESSTSTKHVGGGKTKKTNVPHSNEVR